MRRELLPGKVLCTQISKKENTQIVPVIRDL